MPTGCTLRIAVAADIHAGSIGGLDRVKELARLIESQNPDVILFAGDFLSPAMRGGMSGGTSRRFIPPEDVVAALESLPRRFPTFAVLGDQDWRFNAERTKAALEAAGISVLENRTEALDHGSCRWWITGIGDFSMGQHAVHKAFEGVPPGTRSVVLTHSPEVVREIQAPFALLIAGHTHGGQVRWPWARRPGQSDPEGKRQGQDRLFVTPGIGTSILPVRFNAPPEVSLLELSDLRR